MLTGEFDNQQDMHSSAYFGFLCCTRWFGVTLDWVTVFYLGCCVYSFMLFTDDSIRGGDVGVVLSNCIILTGMVQWGMRQSAEMENHMTSVERVLEYGALTSEADLDTSEDKKPKDPDWPAEGKIKFCDVRLTYNPEDEEPTYVLRGIDFATEPAEKVRIVINGH